MNMLSLDDAYGSGAANDIQDSKDDSFSMPLHHPVASPPTNTHPNQAPQLQQAPPRPSLSHGKPMPSSQVGGGQSPHPRRQVRFVHDSDDTRRHRFARFGPSAAAVQKPQSWLEKNKILVMVIASVTLVILVVVLVVVRKKSAKQVLPGGVRVPAPLAGGDVPAYVGGPPGWGNSASNYGPGPSMMYY